MLQTIITNSFSSSPNLTKCEYNGTWENFLGKFVELMTGDCPTSEYITKSCIGEINAIFIYRVAILFQVAKLEKRGSLEAFSRVFILSWLIADVIETFGIFFHHTLQPMRTMGACFILMDSIIVLCHLYPHLSTRKKYFLFFLSFYVVFYGLPLVALLIDVAINEKMAHTIAMVLTFTAQLTLAIGRFFQVGLNSYRSSAKVLSIPMVYLNFVGDGILIGVIYELYQHKQEFGFSSISSASCVTVWFIADLIMGLQYLYYKKWCCRGEEVNDDVDDDVDDETPINWTNFANGSH